MKTFEERTPEEKKEFLEILDKLTEDAQEEFDDSKEKMELVKNKIRDDLMQKLDFTS